MKGVAAQNGVAADSPPAPSLGPLASLARLAAERPTVRRLKLAHGDVEAVPPSRPAVCEELRIGAGPAAVLFTAIWLTGVGYFVEGLVRERWEHVILGGFVGLTGWWLVRVTWRNYRRSRNDYREAVQKGTLR